MNAYRQHHLTADELDALHEGAELNRVASHLGTCPDCRDLASLDAKLLRALASLPLFDPAIGFADRVISTINHEMPVASPSAVVDTARATAARRRILVGGSVGIGVLVAGFVWAFSNPDAAVGVALPMVRDVGGALWLSVQGLTANAMEQPWFGTISDALATPARALPIVALAAGAYAIGLAGLRRLLTQPASNAGW